MRHRRIADPNGPVFTGFIAQSDSPPARLCDSSPNIGGYHRSYQGPPVPSKFVLFGVIIGSTLIALLLTGSPQVGLNSSNSPLPPDLRNAYERGKELLSQGRYYAARDSFLRASVLAQKLGYSRQASRNLTNAGFCLAASLNFRGAQKDFEKAREMARSTGELAAMAAAQNNLANLYLHMAEPDKALQVADEALAGPEGSVDAGIHGKLLFQRADALAETNRFNEAEPVYRQAIGELTNLDDFDSVARIQGKFGAEYLKAGRLEEAESALVQGLWLDRVHHLNASARILTALAQLKSSQGDTRSAAALFESAINAPPNTTPAWVIRSMRGQFRLDNGDLQGAWDDYREARRIALEMRADIVPADQDRIALETREELSSVMEGLVNSGNRLARQTGDHEVLRQTFDAAEQDRMWSLRALVPSPNDWRSRLPNHYWELLAQYQSLEGTAASGRSPESVQRIETLREEMQKIEARASDGQTHTDRPESPLAHAQSVMDDDTVLLSFLVNKSGAWVWAVDRKHVDVYPVAPMGTISPDTEAFLKAVRAGKTDVTVARRMYCDLFGAVPENYLRHRRWLIEPDGSPERYSLRRAGAGRVARSGAARGPNFLAERAAIELGSRRAAAGPRRVSRRTLRLLGIGDPIYNSADPAMEAEAQSRIWRCRGFPTRRAKWTPYPGPGARRADAADRGATRHRPKVEAAFSAVADCPLSPRT